MRGNDDTAAVAKLYIYSFGSVFRRCFIQRLSEVLFKSVFYNCVY